MGMHLQKERWLENAVLREIVARRFSIITKKTESFVDPLYRNDGHT